jgi:hypothetical protein
MTSRVEPVAIGLPASDRRTYDDVVKTTRALLAYCEKCDWAGHDPYDALNSELFKALPLLNSRVPRLALTQLLKRSPVDVRKLLQIPKTQNAKGIALCLSALLKLHRIGLVDRRDLIWEMIKRLEILRSSGTAYCCWGYSFPWQGRRLLVPAGFPNLVCTTFVANALLDAYEYLQDERCLKMAVNAAEYIVNELYWTDGDDIGFSYPLPSLRGECHNANLLAAALLCRVYAHKRTDQFLDIGLRMARRTVQKQRPDGSWFYGEAPSQRWIDNFHTGYNLGALDSIARYVGTEEFTTAVQRGFEFYRSHFFREDGAPKYFHNRAYPIDIHCVAQSILTLLTFRKFGADDSRQACAVFNWARKRMWDESGFFYYRVLRLYTIRTSYMRWSQGWMLLALSTLISESNRAQVDWPDEALRKRVEVC